MKTAEQVETQNRLETELRQYSTILKQFPRGPMNLTPDAIKATREWKTAKANVDRAFARLRAFNSSIIR